MRRDVRVSSVEVEVDLFDFEKISTTSPYWAWVNLTAVVESGITSHVIRTGYSIDIHGNAEVYSLDEVVSSQKDYEELLEFLSLVSERDDPETVFEELTWIINKKAHREVRNQLVENLLLKLPAKYRRHLFRAATIEDLSEVVRKALREMDL